MRFNFVWRLVVLLAFVVYFLIAFLAILLLAHNFIFALTLPITTIFLIYGVWLLFTDSIGPLGIFATLVWFVVFAVEVTYFFSEAKNRRAFLLLLLFTAAYFELASILRRKYWAEKRELGQASRTAHFIRPVLIINPKAGNGRSMKAHIDKLAEARGIKVIITSKGDDVGVLAEGAANAGADVLGISAGDGSLGAVAKVALKHDLPMIVLPGGTRCHFARDLGLDPERIFDALSCFSGVKRLVDVGTINGRVFLNNASFGLYADIVDHPDYRGHKARVSREVVRSIVSGSKKPYQLEFQHGQTEFKRAVQILVGVNRYDSLNLYELGKRDRLDGGVLQVTVLERLSNETARSLLRFISVDRLSKQQIPGLDQWIGSSFEVSSPAKKLVVGVDGEREEYRSPVKIRVLNKALTVYVPAEGNRGRPKNPFSLSALRQVWRELFSSPQ